MAGKQTITEKEFLHFLTNHYKRKDGTLRLGEDTPPYYYGSIQRARKELELDITKDMVSDYEKIEDIIDELKKKSLPKKVIGNIRSSLRAYLACFKYHDELEGKNDQDSEYIEGILKNDSLSKTEKETLILARIGQGEFRRNLINAQKRCQVTGVSQTDVLIASHIKPWSDCKDNKEERLDINNGLLLSPHIDKMFDKGYLSFADNGDMLIKDSVRAILKEWNVVEKNIGEFSQEQKEYLKFHREKYSFC